MSGNGDHRSEDDLLNKHLRSLWNRALALLALMTGLTFFFAFYLMDKGRIASGLAILILMLILFAIVIKVTLNKAYAMENKIKRVTGRKEHVHEGFVNIVITPMVFAFIFVSLLTFFISTWGILSAIVAVAVWFPLLYN